MLPAAVGDCQFRASKDCTGSDAGVWPQVLIQDGDLVQGTLCKKTLGASEGGLVHVIWMEEGPAAARAFLSQIQYTVNYWLLHHGFSIGIGDTVADTATMQIISRTIQQVGLGCIRS